MNSPAPEKPALYLRVSRNAQELHSQRHAIAGFVRRHGWRLPPKKMTFAEKGSGTKVKRTELDRMLTLARAGDIDTILCYQINRIGRSFLHLVNLLEELDKAKIRVIGVNDDFDSFDQGAYAQKRRRDMVNDAQFERDRIQERTIDGVAAARAQGRVGGKPRKNDAKIARAIALRKTWPGSLRALAKKVGLSPAYLSLIFNGKKRKK